MAGQCSARHWSANACSEGPSFNPDPVYESQPLIAGPSDTKNYATRSIPAREHDPDNRGRRLRRGVIRNYQQPLRRQSVSLASLEPTGRQRVAVDGFGCLRPPAAGAGLRRGETGRVCRLIQASVDGRMPWVRIQRDQMAKILSFYCN